ncbi:tRNA (N6-threonylcarbamoyladenosine(37)-N6)-methyltransferase TrmO [Xylophilus sp. GOD-11R]|uniref:tRNA (N6-threonylcarbamoyladenosine(37)-N6)-methyltransferase TrmO n=1 Tax=Xylophilus sp. GOD-11R TaxID=3089814 RepID=UPI00298C6ED0|nr:tRNA (N6-threonylcarbamoyladenosine(37)-N6)-methyltransferase TrmO [Xylophilus sp. GOD-11R]WPB58403.1 tRNA (N6-threonylcarbamoyladenosine(37)-N6)-methyltransferase TrmO [Xylophilus sp. GOD-11R]
MTSNAPDIVSRPIGHVRSPFDDTVGMPIQTAGSPDARASLEVLPEFAAGLRDIEGFEYLFLITHLHRGTREPLEVVPFLDDASHGVFATRSPARPNRLGLSIVRLLTVEGAVLHFAGNDMVDGTPVLDIKPYVPAFDVRHTDRTGWFAPQLGRLPAMRSDDRMA